MRLYLFSNLYVSSIQHGIQGLHAFTDLLVRYGPTSVEFATAMQWATQHKTVIITCGGYSSTLQAVFDRLTQIAEDWTTEDGQSCLPFAKFHEEKDALAGALTSVAVVVPASAYFTEDRAADGIALQQRAKAMGYTNLFEASGNSTDFTPCERLALLCAAFRLAH